VIINQFNVKSIFALKTENNAPFSPHGHRPEAPQLAFERMQPVAGEVERLRRRGMIEAAKNVFDRFQQIGPYAAPAIAFMEPFQAPVFEAPNH